MTLTLRQERRQAYRFAHHAAAAGIGENFELTEEQSRALRESNIARLKHQRRFGNTPPIPRAMPQPRYAIFSKPVESLIPTE